MAKEDEMGKGTAEEQLVERYRDELANEKAAHAEAERLLSAERAALEVSRAKVLDLEMRAVEAERRENEARADREHVEEQRDEYKESALAYERDIDLARDRLSRVKAAVDALRAAWKDGMIDGVDQALAAVDRALAGVEGPNKTAPDREALGREVRRVWIAWAREQASPKPSWLVPWEGLSEPDREVDRRIGERLWTMGAGVEARPALTEERARALWEEAIREGAKTMRPVDDITVDALLRVARGDFGEAPREPATEQPRTDLAALADAIEANGRTWQRVEPSTVAQALRAVDRRMRTLEAAVTALAASVEHVQATAGIGERRHVVASVGDAEGVAALAGMDPPSKVAGPWTEVEPGIWKRPTVGIRDDYAGSVRVPCENTVAWTAFRDAVETGEWSPVADQGEWHGDVLIGVPFVKELCDEALCAAGWTLQDATEKPASPLQGDVVSDLVLGTIQGQPIRARYTGVTPTEPRKP